ncbi:MAG: SRPBCC family protein [Rhodothermales bacterium]
MDIHRDAPVVATYEAFIDAPRSVVWTVQSELDAWPAWNPDVSSLHLSGPLAPGTEFRWKSGGLPIRSVLREVEPERRIGWTGRAPLGIRAVHTWSFASKDGGTLVRTEESFEGLIARVLSGPMQRMLEDALQKGVAALKVEAERRAKVETT